MYAKSIWMVQIRIALRIGEVTRERILQIMKE